MSVQVSLIDVERVRPSVPNTPLTEDQARIVRISLGVTP